MGHERSGFDVLKQPLLGTHSIEASAGTGKTYSITLLWLRLLVEQRLRVEEILVTTFTRAATAELEERILACLRRARALLDAAAFSNEQTPEAPIVANGVSTMGRAELKAHLDLALSSIDLAPIHTIHGFCQSLIGRYALELGCDPTLELHADAQPILHDLVCDDLMRNSHERLVDLSQAMLVAQAAVAQPLARLLDPIDPAVAQDRIAAYLQPWYEYVQNINVPARSKAALLNKLRVAQETGTIERLSPPQMNCLGSNADDFQAALTNANRIHRALTVSSLHRFAVLARQQFDARKQQASVRTYDDILLTIHRALAQQGSKGTLVRALRERYRAVIVDECQDSDSLQIEVFQRIFGSIGSFTIIGDPKQSIYRFRGADLSSYQQIVAGATQALALTTNYRSDKPLIDSINLLYERRPKFAGSGPERAIRYQPVYAAHQQSRLNDPELHEPVLALWTGETERTLAKRDLARQTAMEFKRLLLSPVFILDGSRQQRRIRASDLAILAANHADLSIVRSELQKLDIPSEQAGLGMGSVFESDEAIDVQLWLRALVLLQARADAHAAILAFEATPLWSVVARESAGSLSTFELTRTLSIDALRLRHEGPLALLQRYWSGGERLASHLRTRNGERRITNWRHMGVLLQTQWASGQKSADELLAWVARQQSTDTQPDPAHLMRLETDLPAVQLATIFAAKGLEYPIVACPFLWHVASHAKRMTAPVAVLRGEDGLVIDIGSERFVDNLEASIEQQNDEQDRILYVALTRARHRLYLGLAPVESNERHRNGASDSAWARLLGLAKTPTDEWLANLPIPVLEPGGLQPIDSTSGNTGNFVLASAPSSLTAVGAKASCVSYSSLLRSEDDTPHDYDPNEPEETRSDPGFLTNLGLRGNQLGQKVHSLLEDILGNGHTVDEATRSLDPAWNSAISTIVQTPIQLGDLPVRLDQLQNRAIAEMHFMLPVGQLSPRELVRALLADPLISANPARRTWACDLQDLDFGALTGFLQGYIDLIFEVGGRFYVVDYKTNLLPDYSLLGVERAMLDHHYLLQARLYALALHRHLRATLTDYAPERHLGGCAYLFLRGFPDRGVWFEELGLATLAPLDALFAKAAP